MKCWHTRRNCDASLIVSRQPWYSNYTLRTCSTSSTSKTWRSRRSRVAHISRRSRIARLSSRSGAACGSWGASVPPVSSCSCGASASSGTCVIRNNKTWQGTYFDAFCDFFTFAGYWLPSAEVFDPLLLWPVNASVSADFSASNSIRSLKSNFDNYIMFKTAKQPTLY